MNEKCFNLCMIREGLDCNNTILLNIYEIDKVNYVSPNEEKDLNKFFHITHQNEIALTSLKETYADIFLLHNINIVSFDGNNETQILYKPDEIKLGDKYNG